MTVAALPRDPFGRADFNKAAEMKPQINQMLTIPYSSERIPPVADAVLPVGMAALIIALASSCLWTALMRIVLDL